MTTDEPLRIRLVPCTECGHPMHTTTCETGHREAAVLRAARDRLFNGSRSPLERAGQPSSFPNPTDRSST